MTPTKKKKHIVLVTSFFPPMRHTAVQRNAALVKYLDKSKFDISVVTSTHHERNTAEIQQNLDCRVIEVSNAFCLGYFDMKKSSSRVTHLMKAIFNKLLSKLAVDEQLGFGRKLKIEIDKLHRQKPIEILITSYAPLAVLKSGIAFKKQHPEITWIADMRDEMSDNPNLDSISKRRLLSWENQTLAHADLLSTVSTPILNGYRTKCKNPKTKFLEIKNGFDFELDASPCEVKSSSKIKIGYFGTLYGEINPNNFFKALDHYSKMYGDLPFEIHFYGRSGSLKVPVSLTNLVYQHGVVTYKESIQKMKEMDSFLLIHPTTPQKGNTTSKIFDYLAINRPILGLVDPNDVAGEMIKLTGSGYISANEDIDGIVRTLRSFYLDRDANRLPQKKWEIIKTYHREVQTNLLQKWIEQQ
ncbi:glycosyltransferase family protein [Bdellovibrio reynosensis]|uniref:Glycosyltransferase n=1 Tax=Bdellovibrio reynosensis TaxID=2835041 RepID=A0ABY4CEN4_9BACT|nr:hypothetical protein [Bdellovibrio reynosensis]UOF02231.1 hypothetical protein MNR06_04620 [Bdellovibrio reynosensis]